MITLLSSFRRRTIQGFLSQGARAAGLRTRHGGISQEQSGDNPAAVFGANGKPDFWIGGEGALNKPLHVAILAKDRTTFEAFYKTTLAAGGRDNGALGIRAHYHPKYCGAFVFDADGHDIEAVCHTPE